MKSKGERKERESQIVQANSGIVVKGTGSILGRRFFSLLMHALCPFQSYTISKKRKRRKMPPHRPCSSDWLSDLHFLSLSWLTHYSAFN